MKSNKNLQKTNYSNKKPINTNKTLKKPINQLFGATGWSLISEALEACGKPCKHLEAGKSTKTFKQAISN